MLDNLDVSDFLGFLSIGCWLGAQFPQVVENIRRQSCEGLALPFLANWLLGDISNLIGCLLTHQLPFQTYLATYFVIVDCMLVAQYFYYYKPPRTHPHSHLRSSTTPISGRRVSLDRGATRYRTLSAVASNVAAAAAALAVQQDDQSDGQRTSRFPYRTSQRSRQVGSGSLVRGSDLAEDTEPSPGMIESFHSEGGRDGMPKRVSWSIERHGGRAASIGRGFRAAPPGLNLANESAVSGRNPDAAAHEGQDLESSTESLTPTIVSARGTRATRRGSTMVFLGAWALFGLGALTNSKRGGIPSSTSSVGRVLYSSQYFDHPVPVALEKPSLYARDRPPLDLEGIELTLPGHSANHPEDPSDDGPHSDEPSTEQVLGRFFAWLCTTLYLTSRLPQIWKNYVRKSVEGLSMYLFIFAFLGNTFYVASILLSPRRYLPEPEATKFIRESIPYILGSAGTLTFDITIVSQSFCYRPRHRRHATALYARVPDEEAAGLLSSDPLSTHPPGDSANFMTRGRTSIARNNPA